MTFTRVMMSLIRTSLYSYFSTLFFLLNANLGRRCPMQPGADDQAPQMWSRTSEPRICDRPAYLARIIIVCHVEERHQPCFVISCDHQRHRSVPWSCLREATYVFIYLFTPCSFLVKYVGHYLVFSCNLLIPCTSLLPIRLLLLWFQSIYCVDVFI